MHAILMNLSTDSLISNFIRIYMYHFIRNLRFIKIIDEEIEKGKHTSKVLGKGLMRRWNSLEFNDFESLNEW